MNLDWSNIDDVMLDMDGTLLDLHFDNHFWLEYVPVKYAEEKGISVEQSKTRLMEQYKKIEGTLDWYCLDHWSRKLQLDIALLKEEIEHLIAVHPYVVDFLEAVKAAGKRTILVTNAHQKALALKMKKTRLDHHFDEIITSHQIGYAKESQQFWAGLQASLPFDPVRTLFVDDSVSVLESARKYGIAHLIAVLKPDTRSPARQVDGFNGVENFKELLPGLQK
ncbi:MAG: GMP/IMP nucleotidase [Gammaproteobacteria bacterium]|jgi:5'-nucleotidase